MALMTVGETVAEAFDAMYHVERARAHADAGLCARADNSMFCSDELAENTARRAGSRDPEFGAVFFAEMRAPAGCAGAGFTERSYSSPGTP